MRPGRQLPWLCCSRVARVQRLVKLDCDRPRSRPGTTAAPKARRAHHRDDAHRGRSPAGIPSPPYARRCASCLPSRGSDPIERADATPRAPRIFWTDSIWLMHSWFSMVMVVVMLVMPIRVIIICVTRIVAAIIRPVVRWNTKSKSHMNSSLGLIRQPGHQTERHER
jgi:hypothetical protein